MKDLQALVLAKKAMKSADDHLDDELGLGLGFDDPSYSCAPVRVLKRIRPQQATDVSTDAVSDFS